MTGPMIIACAGLIAAVASPTAAVAADPPRKLFVYGDSLAIGTEPYLPRVLPEWRVVQDVYVNRRARSAPRVLRNRGARLEPVIHLSLGTVDNPEQPGRFRRAVRRTMRVVGRDRCVVWPNIARPGRRKDGTGYNAWRPLNRILNDEAARWDNLVVVDWLSLYRAHPEWISRVDGTHVNKRGYRARARLVANGVAECYERLRRRGTS